MASWVKSVVLRRNGSDSIYVDDPIKLLSDPTFMSLENEEKAKAVESLMKQTREATQETALLLHFYSIKPWEKCRLSKIQKAGLLWNIPTMQKLKEFFARQSETDVGYAQILDVLDPSKSETGISYSETAIFKSDVAQAKRELGL